ncbi:MAG: molybdate ABC transporter permease subunit [Frankiaceae bacterium]|nr:molybdate ABC transporter permease subunit [Frankiaceae bacterium]
MPATAVKPARPPLSLATAAAAGAVFLLLPLVSLIDRTPWHSLPRLLTSSSSLTALRLSLECSLGALALSLVVGVPLAWLLARVEFRGKSLLRAAVTLPLVLPPVVGGVALLLAFGRHGVVPLSLAFTTWGAILAEAFVALPFLVLAVEGALLAVDKRYDDVAATLGSSTTRTFFRVTLPLVLPAVAAGSALAWARALGEFGATITFAGNLPGSTQTLPLDVYLTLQSDPEGAIALSTLLLALSLVVLVAMRSRWRLTR